MSNARDYLFKVPFRQYSIPNWEVNKKKILDTLPINSYTDFYENKKHGLPQYINVIGSVIDEAMLDFKDTYPPGVMITSMWYERSKKGDYHGPHNHGATGFSAILYVEYSGSDHEPTKFHAPFLDAATGENMKYQPVVREGDLLVFPSYILHEAPINNSDIDRTIVSFNIMGEDVAKAWKDGFVNAKK